MSTSGTNGWDAVFAMNTAQINQIFFQQYLKEGPTRQASRLRFLVDAGQPNQFYVLDSTLGPPEVNLKESTLQMFILSGTLFFVDAGRSAGSCRSGTILFFAARCTLTRSP